MPIISVNLLAGVASPQQKTELLQKITTAVVSTFGEAIKPLTIVQLHESPNGEIFFGGNQLTTEHAREVLGKARASGSA